MILESNRAKQYNSMTLASFADSQLTDAIRMLAQDASTDPKVKKKLLAVLASWHAQFKDDPSMSLVANLYRQSKSSDAQARTRAEGLVLSTGGVEYDSEFIEKKRREEREKRERKEEEKRKSREHKEAEKARLKAEEEARRKKAAQPKSKRKPFNFEQVSSICLCLLSMLIIRICRRNLRFSIPLLEHPRRLTIW